MKNLTILFLLGASAASHAATVAYYRFEDVADTPATFADSGPSPAADLTNSGGVLQDFDEPDGAFPSTVPFSGASNTRVLSVLGTDSITSTDAKFALSTFTVEGYVSIRSTSTSTQYIASRYSSGGSNRSFGFGIASSNGTGTAGGNTLFGLLSETGSSGTVIASGLSALVIDHVYYVAMSYFDNGSGVDTTFYLQDITAGGVLETSSVDSGIDTLNTTSTAPFRVGGVTNSSSGVSSVLNGNLDEVRFSDTVLGQSELLIAVPEPGVAILGLLGLIPLLRRCRE